MYKGPKWELYFIIKASFIFKPKYYYDESNWIIIRLEWLCFEIMTSWRIA